MAEKDSGLQEKLDLFAKIIYARMVARNKIIPMFIPNKPSAKPFEKQIAFFKSRSLIRLLRCGNRGGKTFSTMRDLAWKLTRTHPYLAKYNCEYSQSKPKIFWMLGPDYEFVNDVMWKEYLTAFIPEWYYIPDTSMEPNVEKTNQGNIERVTFRNGDVLMFKTYSQQDLSLMGRAVDEVYIDEMPKNIKLIGELITRTLDKDGGMTMGFTPLNPVEEIKTYVENNAHVHVLSWSLLDNPLFRDDAQKQARALSVWKDLPKNEYNSRLNGDWYEERVGGRVFEGVEPIQIDDFPIPLSWRQVRVVDPAARMSGLSIFAEDPDTKIWYWHVGRQIEWKNTRAKAEDILVEIDKSKPYKEFKYKLSLYDNAEAWFGAYGAAYGFIPCLLKNREDAIMKLRTAIVNGKIVFFKKGAALAYKQFVNYHYKDSGLINKANDHVLDCGLYFARQIPEPVAYVQPSPEDERAYVCFQHLQNLENRDKRKAQEQRYPMALRPNFSRRSLR